jgi:hypothetical protein
VVEVDEVEVEVGAEGVEVEEMEVEEVEDEIMADDVDEAIDETETEENTTVTGISEPETSSSTQKACLTFCIALLSQSITRKEYDSPLVCALAMLGVKEGGWQSSRLFPPVLPAAMKVARSMMVQQSLELSGPFDEDDSAYESDDGNPRRRQRKGCLQLVQEIVHQLMVRGRRSLMQWMLDLRTYGLKIHYNTTSCGHVEWAGQDEVLYKDLQFNLGQFRAMVHDLTTESRRLLMDELLCGNSTAAEPIPSVLCESLHDNLTDKCPGWNFSKDHRSCMPVDGEQWLSQRVG